MSEPEHPSSFRESTLTEVLSRRARSHGDRLAYTFLAEGEEEEEAHLTFGELDRQARAVAAALQTRVAEGERALLLYPPGLDFLPAFLGCLYAGVTAVPAPPPGRRAQGLERVVGILADARPRITLTTEGLASRLEPQIAALPEAADLGWLVTDRLAVEAGEGWRPAASSPDRVAFLQYTSGSTSAPKGVVVSHGNLLANELAIQRAFEQSESSVVVGWLPLHHDMGLIGNVLQPLWCGARAVLMSPLAFLQRPRRWLAAITRYRATTSGGPDFAYALCVRKIPPEERRGLDLESWRVAFNGAEPVRAQTLERFAEAFAPCGFQHRAFFPCYGLAEATLFVSGGEVEADPVVCRLTANERQPPGAAGREGARRRVGCGRVSPGHRLVIVDPETRVPCPPGQEGEVWVAGPSVAGGYWRQPEETERTFRARLADGGGPYLRTGDLGLTDARGELFLTGRLKDLIILRGRNLYPQDLEITAAESHPALVPHGAAAFSVDTAGEERLVVVQEIARRREGEAAAAAAVIREAVLREHEASAHAVVVIRAGTLPRTTSGKVRRHVCREDFLAGCLSVLAASAAGGTGAEVPAAEAELDPGGDAGLEARVRLHAAQVLGFAPASLAATAELPLDSLQAVELKNRLEAELGLGVPLGLLLGGASCRRIAEEAAAVPTPPIPAGGSSEADEPVSYGPRALWFLHRLAPSSAAYHVAFAARLGLEAGGGPDADTLRQRFRWMATRHPALVATYHEVNGEPVQRNPRDRTLEVVEIDAAGWSRERLEAYLDETIAEPFDLERGPVARVRLLRTGEPAAEPPIVVFAAHHIAVDFWSLALLLEDLAGLETPSPTFTCADHARWQQRLLEGPEGERLWRYWKDLLADAPPALELPSDRPRPPVPSHRGIASPFVLDAELAAAARAVAGRSGTTLFTVLLAAFQGLLHRLTGLPDFLVGVPAAGRSRAAFENVVGYFANLLPLRADLSGDPSFGELIERTRFRGVGALEHQDFPFPLLVERLQPVRDPARPPLAPVGFVLETPRRLREEGVARFALGEGGAVVRLGDLVLESLPVTRRGAHFDLILKLVDAGGSIAASLEAAADLFDPTTLARLAAHFRHLLAAAVADRDRRITELPLLSAGERQQILREWNDTEVSWPADRLLHELFETWAAKVPDAVAVEHRSDGIVSALSYGELARRAGGLARHLRALGVGADVPVVLLLGRSPELILGALAVLGAGGAYLPADPGWPPDRISRLLADSGAPVVVSRGPSARDLPPGPFEVVRLDREGATRQKDPGSAGPVPRVDPDNLAYVLYTSGSTGAPKGVAVPHRSVVNMIAFTRGSCGLGPGDRVLQFAAPSFDASVLEIFMALSSGATLCLVAAEARRCGPELLTELRDRQLTRAVLVPSVLQLVSHPDLPALSTVIAGGEVLPLAVATGWAVGRRLINGYGPTEASVYVSLYDCPPELEAAPPIGRPVTNLRLRVLDRHLMPLPVGVPGELCIGGTGLARGYLRRASTTAESFVPAPFPRVPGERIYRTGDLARYRCDGELEFLGRIDHQVKIRGLRIEPGEIEAALLRHPSVQAAVVMAQRDRLVAYVVAEAEGNGSPSLSAELRDSLAGSLPDTMVPSAFVRLNALPRTSHGKLDREALPHPEPSPVAGQVPRSALERELAALWCEVLELDRVGVEDNLFDLGGHSLAAARLHARICESLAPELPLVDLFTHPTIASLAAHLSRRSADPPESEAPAASEAAHQRADERRRRLRRSRLRRQQATEPRTFSETARTQDELDGPT